MFFHYEDIKLKNTITTEDLEKWCAENLDGEWIFGNISVFFSLESDAVAFKLRWL